MVLGRWFLSLTILGSMSWAHDGPKKRSFATPEGVKKCLALISLTQVMETKLEAGTKIYPVDGFIKNSYNWSFEPVLKPFSSLEELAKSRTKQNKSSHLLDLAGSAVFSAKPKLFNSLTGFRVGTMRSLLYSENPSEGLKQHDEVYGSAYEPASWKKLDKNMNDRGIPSFDIIVARPIGGTESVRDGAVALDAHDEAMHIFKRVVDRSWERLSFDDGELLLEVKWNGSESEKAWLERVRHSGVGVSYVDVQDGNSKSFVIRLTKTKSSPSKLPD